MTKRIAALLILCGVVGGALAMHRGHAGTAPSAFTIVLKEETISDRGVKAITAVNTVGYRADGSVAKVSQRQWLLPAKGVPTEAVEQHIINDVEKKIQVSAYPLLRMKATVPLSDPLIAKLRPHATNPLCNNTPGFKQTGPSETILGYTVIHFVNTNLNASHPVDKIEEWRAPDLRCAVLKLDFRGDAMERTTKIATSITTGDPDPNMFTVPSDYKESRPSEMVTAMVDLQGRQCAACELKAGKNADANYNRRRSGMR